MGAERAAGERGPGPAGAGADPPLRDKPRGVRLAQGAAFLVGAVVFALLVWHGPLSFWWTPLLVGLAYLAAALVGGRTGGQWAAGLTLIGWGVAVVLVNEAGADVPAASAYLLGAGLGGMAAAAAARWGGVRADGMGIAATIAAGGLLFVLEPAVDPFGEPWFYVALLAAVGAFNLALGARRPQAG